MLPASRQSKLLRCHLLTPTLFRRHCQNSTAAQCDSPPSPSPEGESLLNQALKLLQSPENDWNSDQLRNLLFSNEFSLPHILEITLSLGSSSRALNFLEYVKSNAPSEQNRYPSFVFYGVLKLLIREPISKTRVLELYNIVKERRVPLTTKSAILLIQILEKAEMADELFFLFNDLEPSLKSTGIFNTSVNVLLRLGRTDDALKVLDEMLKPNTESPPNDVTGNIVFTEFLKIKSCGRSITEEEIGGLVRKLSKCCVFPDTYKLTQMINKLCRKKKTNLAWDLLHDLMKLGVSVSATSCNALLTGLGKNGDVKRMNDLLAEMKEVKIQPSVVTFGILINHLCKSRKIDDALDLLEKMRGKGESSGMKVEPDVVIFNTLIDGLCKVGRQDEGLSLLEEMKNHNKHRPDAITYNCLIDGFCKAGNLDKAHELLDEMNKEGVQPNVVTMNALLDGMCKHGRIGSANDFFSEMQKKGIKGNTVTYSVLISAYCSVNNIDKAMYYFDMMLSSRCSPDPMVFYSLISGLSIAGRMDDASHVVSNLKQAGFGLDLYCYNVLISGFCKKKKFEKVKEMLEEMEQVGVKPDAVTYNTLISFLGKSGDFGTASKIMRKMIGDGLEPSVVTYGAVIHAYCLHGKVDEAMKIFGKMNSTKKVPPNTIIYNILIGALCKTNEVESSVSLLDEMKVKGVKPNTVTYNAIFKGLQNKRMINKAFELMDRMVEDACKPDYVTMEILTEWFDAVGQLKKLKSFVRGFEVSRSGV